MSMQPSPAAQIREQMSGPDLHVFTLKFLALKKTGFFTFSGFQCGRYSVFKKIKKKIFDPEKVKKRASKVAHNWPTPFYFTVQPRPQPTAQN